MFDNLLLQLLDEGILTDSKGETVSFRETCIILTTNIGVSEIMSEEIKPGFRAPEVKTSADKPKEKLSELSHEQKSKITRKTLEKKFPPEFLNRIDEIVVFRALTKDDNLKILEILVNEVSARVANIDMGIEFTPEVKTFLVDKGTDVKYGARPLKRTLHRYIENPLAEQILKGEKFKKGDLITAVSGKDGDGELTVEFNVTGTVPIKEPAAKEPPTPAPDKEKSEKEKSKK